MFWEDKYKVERRIISQKNMRILYTKQRNMLRTLHSLTWLRAKRFFLSQLCDENQLRKMID